MKCPKLEVDVQVEFGSRMMLNCPYIFIWVNWQNIYKNEYKTRATQRLLSDNRKDVRFTRGALCSQR